MIKYREIDVRKQRNLSFAKTFSMCWKGIAHRLLRSVLTLAVVVLAVAFFMFLLSENAFVGATARGVMGETEASRYAASFIARAYEVPPLPAVAARLASAGNDVARIGEYAKLTGIPEENLAALAERAVLEREYLRFINNVPAGKKVILFGRFRGRDVFRNLSDAEAFAKFEARIEPMLDVEVPGGIESFRAFLDGYGNYEKDLKECLAAWRDAVRGLRRQSERMWGKGEPTEWLANADADQLSQWRKLVAEYGIQLSDADLEKLKSQLEEAKLLQTIHAKLSRPEMRDAWRKAFMERQHISTDAKMLRLGDDRVVDLLSGEYSRKELAAISERVARDRRLTILERRLAGKIDLDSDQLLSARQFFLLLISFMVCMVGIANAMLMSITERFREIATMKCLGATDRYILVQFMLEAALQGVAGGLLGMFIGFIIATVKNTVLFGGQVYLNWPMVTLLTSALFAIGAGVLLAVLASVYPSWAASRMAPMEAMRVE